MYIFLNRWKRGEHTLNSIEAGYILLQIDRNGVYIVGNRWKHREHTLNLIEAECTQLMIDGSGDISVRN